MPKTFDQKQEMMMSARTERPKSQHFYVLNKEKKSHAMSARGGSMSGGTKISPSVGVGQILNEIPNVSGKGTGGQEPLKIKLQVVDETKSKTVPNQTASSNKKKETLSKASAEDEVTQNLMERIRTKIKAMNTLIAEGRAQNFTDFDSISTTSERNLNFKLVKNPVFGKTL